MCSDSKCVYDYIDSECQPAICMSSALLSNHQNDFFVYHDDPYVVTILHVLYSFRSMYYMNYTLYI